jgi:hypothetical protein
MLMKNHKCCYQVGGEESQPIRVREGLAESVGFFRLIRLAQEIEDLPSNLLGQGFTAFDHLGNVRRK